MESQADLALVRLTFASTDNRQLNEFYIAVFAAIPLVPLLFMRRSRQFIQVQAIEDLVVIVARRCDRIV